MCSTGQSLVDETGSEKVPRSSLDAVESKRDATIDHATASQVLSMQRLAARDPGCAHKLDPALTLMIDAVVKRRHRDDQPF